MLAQYVWAASSSLLGRNVYEVIREAPTERQFRLLQKIPELVIAANLLLPPYQV